MTSYLVPFSELSQLIFQILNTLLLLATFLGRGGLGTTYDVHLGLIGKRVNWTFFARCYGWVATSEKRSKIGDFTPTRPVWYKISGRRGRPTNHCARIVRLMNALQLCRWQFSHKETLWLSLSEVLFYTEIGRFAFWAPFGRLKGHVQWSS